MFIVYDLIFLLIGIFYLPAYILRRKFHRGFLARFGRVPRELEFQRPIWVHAVSVGEAMAARGLIEALRSRYPSKKFVISTVTPTGNKIARGLAREGDFVTYLPVDLSFIIRRVIHRIRPCIFIIAEAELWPNLITAVSRHSIPIAIVNTRISDISFRGYRSAKLFFRPILNKINLFCVQTGRDAERLQGLGVSGEKIRVTGNLKFDIAVGPQKESRAYKLKLGLEAKDQLFVAGSTHPGEEEEILKVYRDLLREGFVRLKLLIAPRHPERAKEVARIVSQFGFQAIFTSALPYQCSTCLTRPVFILDAVGELVSYYSAADIVFVGGSLIRKGGHNILEPASLGKPVLFGPYMFNFRDISDLFLSHQAAIIVHDSDELRKNIQRLLDNPSQAAELAQRGQGIIAENRGATLKTLENLEALNF
jgi:3-deoxy-D-manno-octulosonic-acid transferase